MLRNLTYSALILRVKPSGESNREAWFLSAEAGLIKATVFGGAKSSLRSLVAPFHEGKLMIYHDPVKDSRKVSDFDVQLWRPGIRESWERATVAGILAETILLSQGGGGNWPDAIKLAGTVLDTLNEAPDETCTRIAVYFLWHWARILGVKPDLSHCGSCCREVSMEEPIWYSCKKETLFCDKCRGKLQIFDSTQQSAPERVHVRTTDSLRRIDPGTRLWLAKLEMIPPSALDGDTTALEQAKALSQAVLTNALGRRPSTWDGI